MLVFDKNAATDPATVEAVRRIVHRGLAFGAAGLVGRMGLEAIRPTQAPKVPFVSPGPSNVSIAIPDRAPDKKPLKKTATLEDLVNAVSEPVARGVDALSNYTKPLLGTPTLAKHKWPMIALSMGVPVAAAYGGYRVADSLLDARRQRLADQDVEEAKKDYEEALSGKSKMAAAVDALADLVVKQGGWTGDLGNIPVGYLAAGMLGAGAGGAILGYNMTSKGAQPKLVSKAVRERAKRMWMASQQPIHFVRAPQPQTNGLNAR